MEGFSTSNKSQQVPYALMQQKGRDVLKTFKLACGWKDFKEEKKSCVEHLCNF